MKKFDIIFISYDEENAETNWQKLKTNYPYAKRVHRIEGIHHAHRKASELAETTHFFTVDGDNTIINNPFTSTLDPDYLKQNTVYVWRSINAVNGLVYGYGGVKLWPKKLFQESKHFNEYTDHAMEICKDYKVIKMIGSRTEFNTSPYSSWKSGHREAYKLARNYFENDDQRALNWLRTWTSVGSHADHGLWCILGAFDGIDKYLNEVDPVKKQINCFESLHKSFQEKEKKNPLDLIKKYSHIEKFKDLSQELLSPKESLEKFTHETRLYRSKVEANHS